MDQSRCEACVGEIKITDLVFGDAAVLLAESVEVMMLSLEVLHKGPKPLGLKVFGTVTLRLAG